jgi:hypothetical protein
MITIFFTQFFGFFRIFKIFFLLLFLASITSCISTRVPSSKHNASIKLNTISSMQSAILSEHPNLKPLVSEIDSVPFVDTFAIRNQFKLAHSISIPSLCNKKNNSDSILSDSSTSTKTTDSILWILPDTFIVEKGDNYKLNIDVRDGVLYHDLQVFQDTIFTYDKFNITVENKKWYSILFKQIKHNLHLYGFYFLLLALILYIVRTIFKVLFFR